MHNESNCIKPVEVIFSGLFMLWSLKMDMIMDNVIVFTCNIVSELCDGAVNDIVVSLLLFQSSSI